MRMLIQVLFICLLCQTTFAKETPQITDLKIKFEGVPKNIEAEIRKQLDLLQYKPYALKSSERLHLMYSDSKTQIKDTLKAFGYYKSEVSSDIKPQNNIWDIQYQIKLGPPLRIDDITLKVDGPGKNKDFFKKAIKKLPIQIGKLFIYSQYESAKSSLLTTAINYGYFKAHLIDSIVKINIPQYKAWIDLELDTGPRYHFGPVKFEQDLLSEDFLKRYIKFDQNIYFDNKLVNKLQNNLSESGYYSTAQVVPAPRDKNGIYDVPMTIKLKPHKRNLFTFGLGYGTDSGPGIQLGWNVRYIGKYGHKFNFKSKIYSTIKTFTAQYVIPGDNPVTDAFIIDAGRKSTNITAYKSTESLLGFQIKNQLTPNIKSLFETHIHLVHYQLQGNSDFSNAHYLIPSYSLFYLNQKTVKDWPSGISDQLQVRAALKPLVSTSSFAQINNEFRFSLPISKQNRFYFRSTFGTTWLNGDTELAPTLLFYAGGFNSVRGFGYRTLGPLKNGNLRGGKSQFTNSFNLEQRLTTNLSLIGFYDVGNAFNNFGNVEYAQGAGIGLSYQTPIGPIQAFFAHPVGGSEGSFQFDINIGGFLEH